MSDHNQSPPPEPASAASVPSATQPEPGPPPAAYYPPPGYLAYPPPGYVAYPSPAPIAAQARTNGLAIAALVLGILWLYGIGSILAIVFGHVAMSQIDRSGGSQSGRGMALAGAILGYVGAALFVFVLLFVAAL